MKIAFSHTEINVEEWKRFIATHAESTFFHSPEYYFAFQVDECAKNHLVAVLSDESEIFAISVFTVYREKTIKGYFSRRAISMAPPIVKDNSQSILLLLLQELDKYLARKVIYHEIRNIKQEKAPAFVNSKYQLSDRLDIKINLQEDWNSIESNISPKARNKIRKAEKLNLHFAEITTFAEIERAFILINSVYDRIKYPFLSCKAFTFMVESLLRQEKLRLFGVFSTEDLVSVMLVSSHKDEWYCWYLGTKRMSYTKGASEFLSYNIFQLAKKQNIHSFDWGGAGVPNVNYGVRDFKKKFGGEFIKEYRATYIYNSILHYFSKIVFKIYLFFNKRHGKK